MKKYVILVVVLLALLLGVFGFVVFSKNETVDVLIQNYFEKPDDEILENLYEKIDDSNKEIIFNEIEEYFDDLSKYEVVKDLTLELDSYFNNEISVYFDAVELFKREFYYDSLVKLDVDFKDDIISKEASSLLGIIESVAVESVTRKASLMSDTDLDECILYLEEEINGYSKFFNSEILNNALSDYKLRKYDGYNVDNFKEINYRDGVNLIKGQEGSLILVASEMCPYCVKFNPVINMSFDKINKEINYIDTKNNSVNDDGYSDFVSLIGDYSSGIPTLIYVQYGIVVDGILGYVSYDKLMEFYDRIEILK